MLFVEVMQASAKAEWKVVSTHFGKLECALNDLSADGFSIWKLIVLSPESTRTKRFVVIVIARRDQGSKCAEERTKGDKLELDAGEIYFIDANNLNAESAKAGKIDKRYIANSEIKNDGEQKKSTVKQWEGMLRDPAGRSTRRTGRFEVREDP
jgi:hypothetical protein